MSARPQRKPNQYHLNAQRAAVLLGPVRATLRELEKRVRHYAERMPLEAADEEALRDAHRVLETARRDLEQVWQESARGPRSGEEAGA